MANPKGDPNRKLNLPQRASEVADEIGALCHHLDKEQVRVTQSLCTMALLCGYDIADRHSRTVVVIRVTTAEG